MVVGSHCELLLIPEIVGIVKAYKKNLMVGVITFILVHEKEGGKFLNFIYDIYFYDKSALFSTCFAVNIFVEI